MASVRKASSESLTNTVYIILVFSAVILLFLHPSSITFNKFNNFNMPSSTFTNTSDFQFSSDPNLWLYRQHACGPVNPFESVYSATYYIVDKSAAPKKSSRIRRLLDRLFKE